MIGASRTVKAVAVAAVAGLLFAGCAKSAENKPADAGKGSTSGNGELVVGAFLPVTGNLAYLGPPEFAGVHLAAKEINEAGGVLGKPIVVKDQDSGDSSMDIANQGIDVLNGAKTDVIIGAASSGVTKIVLDKVVGFNMMMVSPANTAPDLTDAKDNGLYFRTAPSDVLQGQVLADLIVGDGKTNVGIMFLDDPYGSGLAENARKGIEKAGGKVSGEPLKYDAKAANFAAEVTKLKATSPDAIAIIGFDEITKIIPELIAQGIGPAAKSIYLVDGNLAQFADQFPAGTLKGVKGTLPGVKASDEFRARLMAIDPKLKDFSYAPEAYDATILSALAAIAAKSDAGPDMAKKMEEVSKGGTKCTKFSECKKLLEAGTDIDYDGLSGPIEFSEKGDPTKADIGIYQYGDDNKYTWVASRSNK